ncbi:MAG TPA: hypothetical protein VLX92_25100 [Kofleriaceae bacterium]|nr:hypothetical protein [Kofleriaceae bacterium]
MTSGFALAFALAAGCAAPHGTIDGGSGSSHDHGGDGGSGSGSGSSDAGITDVACSGTATGGLSGSLSDCQTSYVFAYSDGRYDTAIGFDELNGQPLDAGPCDFDFELDDLPDTSTTYTFSNVHGGVANLYQNHSEAPMTIWACGSNGTVTYGSDLAMTFSSVTYVGEADGTKEYQLHGQTSCHFEAADGSPAIDVALAF